MSKQEIQKKNTEQNFVGQSFIIIIIFSAIVITFLSFMRIYWNKNDQITNSLKAESQLLKVAALDNLHYAKFLLKVLEKSIAQKPDNMAHVNKILKKHLVSADMHNLFGWKYFVWVDKNFIKRVSSNRGILEEKEEVAFIKNFIQKGGYTKEIWEDGIIFNTSEEVLKKEKIKIINIIHDENNEFIGAIVLNYDINSMFKNLDFRKKNSYTNFLILNQEKRVVVKSKDKIKNIYDSETGISDILKGAFKDIDLFSQEPIEKTDLHIYNGINYYINKLQDVPFSIVVNVDNASITSDIIESVVKKSIEVTTISFFCLLFVIFIYRREKSLRTKAEELGIKASNASKSKTDFLAFTAHEIRSPLGFILTGSEMMERELLGKMPEVYKKYVTGINHNSQIILDFIIDILDENQILEGKFKIINKINNIEDIIKESIEINKAKYSDIDFEITVEIEDSLPKLICDRRRIFQIMNNLLSNSVKYSKGDPVINIILRVVDHTMEIIVKDCGVGMQENEIEIAMSIYGTLDNTPRDIDSYGLGLVIVKMLLEAHDADFYINSAREVGTTIKMIFPEYKLVYGSKKGAIK